MSPMRPPGLPVAAPQGVRHEGPKQRGAKSGRSPSDSDQLSSLSERRMDQATFDVAPFADSLLARNDHVGCEHQAAQRPPQAHGLLGRILDLRLGHQEVKGRCACRPRLLRVIRTG